jgi:hypothetical protein
MKRLLLILILFAGISFAEDKNAVGLWASNYGSGFDLKRLNNNNTVLDVYLGSGLGIGSRGLTSIGLDAGYYFLKPKVIKVDASSGKFPMHWGPNFGFGYWVDGDRKARNRVSHLVIAPNCALGISWFPPTNFKWDVSIELFPGLRIYRDSYESANSNKWDSETNLGLGVDLRLLVHAYLF